MYYKPLMPFHFKSQRLWLYGFTVSVWYHVSMDTQVAVELRDFLCVILTVNHASLCHATWPCVCSAQTRLLPGYKMAKTFLLPRKYFTCRF